ncbi:integrase [Marinobacterium nitratireducens]|uniref:Integrase n=1 Tax=Marinobacterium nitratireducens TaxID=518897 RepID=A0A917ZJH6_9GAMM|nr:site-specific integrase [Marinobacterium nitratireducens]GGO83821.1 integrase [Marinobacterium nitratireducens]
MNRAPKDPLLGCVESFFRDYLQRLRGASPHTVRAYRDTLRLLFIYLADTKGCAVADLQLSDLRVDEIAAFLTQLESVRANAIATRNCRLAAIRSFCKHLIRVDLPHAEQYQRILALPAKKCRQPLAVYLEAEEVHAIIDQPDRRTALGQRDHGLLLFLYNTGARISEALAVCCADLHLTPPRQVRLHGKGRKDRLCPLWRETTQALQRLPTVRDGKPGGFVFVNRQGQPLTRDGVAYLLRKYVAAAIPSAPTLRRRKITPHVLRHSCAVALLQSGVDITVIRDYLGHASVATTSRYLTTNLQMKRAALEAFWKRAGITPVNAKPWHPSPDLLAFLASL